MKTDTVNPEAIDASSPGNLPEMTSEMDRRNVPSMDTTAKPPPKSPFRLQRILVPIDFSDCAKKALQYPIPLAKQYEASLTLIYVVPTQYAVGEFGGLDYASLEIEVRTNGEKELAKLALEEVRDEVPTDTLVRAGPPAFEIIEAARELPADVIIISTHGYTGLKHVMLASVVEHVVRRAPCPVLVVREHEHEFLAT